MDRRARAGHTTWSVVIAAALCLGIGRGPAASGRQRSSMRIWASLWSSPAAGVYRRNLEAPST